MRAWNAFDSLRDSNAAKSRLIAILRRERARSYAQSRPEIEWTEDLEELVGFEQSHSDIEIVTLRRALATLSEDYREPLLLQVIGGYSCEEIAEIMGLQPGAVMTRLSRARQKLRPKLEGNDKTTVNSCI
jgi:RNA polymerase sigma-70 factor (ECF subfamily)